MLPTYILILYGFGAKKCLRVVQEKVTNNSSGLLYNITKNIDIELC